MRSPTSSRWSSPDYHVQVRFRAPLRFVYDWCTDFTPNDAELEGESYQRKVVSRTRHQVIFEDLEEGKDGWGWTRKTIDLLPPSHWTMDGVGNRRDIRARYSLTSLPDGRTQLDLWAHRRVKVAGGKNPSKPSWEREVTAEWRLFARNLEKDYRASQTRRRSNP